MARSLSYKVTDADDNMRLDVMCADRGLYPSRSIAVKHIEEGRVFVNGSTVAKKHLVTSGDIVVYEVFEEVAHIPLMGENIPLDIVYDDDDIIVLSKQAGLVCHPSPGHEGATLVHALIYHFGRENLAHIQGDDRPGIVHRLDGDTSGLMLAAKNDAAGEALQEEIRLRTIDRRYICLVHGNISHDTGLVDAPIARGDHDRLRMRVSDRENARPSVTTITVLERFEAGTNDDGYTLVECKLHTGRTHQIRVHMQYINHPCVGDPAYGKGAAAIQLGLTRQFLHSYRLSFDHPTTHEAMDFVDTLPEDLQQALSLLKSRSRGRTKAGDEVFSMFESKA